MINGLHALFYAKDAGKARAFMRDVLKFPHLDAGHGWLIFAAPPAELAAHPLHGKKQHQELYFMCDDVKKTVTELKAAGVRITKPISNQGYGLVTAFEFPGAGEVGLYEPRHPIAAGMKPARRTERIVETGAKKKVANRRRAKAR